MRLIDADKLKQHYSWWNNEEQRTFDQIVDAQPTIGGEYIPREWLLKNTNTGMNVIEMMQAIKDAPVTLLPAVDATPVVHGEWIDCAASEHWCCSKCGIRAPMMWDPLSQEYFEWLSPACPNCGAKMDGGDSDALD